MPAEGLADAFGDLGLFAARELRAHRGVTTAEDQHRLGKVIKVDHRRRRGQVAGTRAYRG